LETEEEKALAVAADFLDSWGQGSLSNLEGYHFNDVGKDPFIMGGYTSPGIGSWPTHNPQHSANTKIAQPIGTALYFAGEGTNTSGASGLVSGAIETGERAALEVDADHSPGDGRGADAVCELKVKSGAAESLHVETFSTDDGLRLALDDFVW
jgi:monoamine oxidase